MLKRPFLVLFLSLFAVFLQGCSNPNFIIVAPTDAEQHEDSIPQNFKFIYLASAPKSVTLNGVNIINYFDMADGEGVADGTKLEAFLKQGINSFAIESAQFGPRAEFFLDTAGPKIVITEVTGADSKTITGKAIDPSGVSEVIINGTAAALDENDVFTISIQKAPMYTIVAYDDKRRMSEVKYASRDTEAREGLKIMLKQEALDATVPILQEVVEDLDLSEIIAGNSSGALFRENIGVNLPKVKLVPEICAPQVCLPEVCTPQVCLPFVGCTPKICTPGVCTPGVCTPEVAVGPVNVSILELEASLSEMSIGELEIDKLDLASGNKPLTGAWKGISLDGSIRDTDIGIRIRTYVLGVTDVVSTILDFLGLSDTLDALDGNFTVGLTAPRLRIAADLGLTASDGNVDITLADINAVGLGSFNSDFNTNIQLPNAFNLFGFGLAQTVTNTITGGLSGARDLILEVLLGNLLPAIADPIVDSLVNQLRFGIRAGVSNNTILNAQFEINGLEVVNNDTALIVSMDSLIGAEQGDLDEPDIGFSTSSTPAADIIWVSDHLLPDKKPFYETLGPAPDLAPQALGYRYNLPMLHNPADLGNLSVLTSSTVVNQALMAFHETALLQFSLGYRQGEITNVLSPDQTHRMNLLPGTPVELIFKGNDPAVAYLSINNFGIQFAEQLAPEEWSVIRELNINADVPVVIAVENNNIYLALLTTDLNVVGTNSDSSQFNIFDLNAFLNRILLTFIIEQINMGLAQLDLPGVLDLEHDGATLKATIEKVVVSPGKNLQLSLSLD